ncbi:MAG: tRNA pseudouridine(38-40) synthase TruA [Phycisphaeraceae bacterium]
MSTHHQITAGLEIGETEAVEPTLRYRMRIAYDGSEFYGWQHQQRPGEAPMRTVQGVLRDAMQRALGQPIKLQGASRTDSGVHAVGQAAHFDAATRIPLDRIAKAINCQLPADVEVREVALAPPGFDAIRTAVAKQYRYRIWTTEHRPLHLRRMVWHCWTPLDVQAMREAAAMLEGEHDFAGFATAGHGRQTTVRTINKCEVLAMPRDPVLGGPELHVIVSGNGFLYNMVRIVVGTLVDIGRGRWGPSHVQRLLTEGDRAAAGPTAPAHGLMLEWIRYRGDADEAC